MTEQTRLIGIGIRLGILANELQVGERFMRNYGYTYKILHVLPHKSQKSITFVVEGETKHEKGRTLQKNIMNKTIIAKLSAEEER